MEDSKIIDISDSDQLYYNVIMVRVSDDSPWRYFKKWNRNRTPFLCKSFMDARKFKAGFDGLTELYDIKSKLISKLGTQKVAVLRIGVLWEEH